MTRALVLGGAGFIGTAACKELMRRGVETIAAGRRDRPYGTFTSYVAFDRDDEAQLKRALESVQPDVVLDLAGDEPMQVEAMIRSFKGDRYVFVSSGVVYPDIDGRPALLEAIGRAMARPANLRPVPFEDLPDSASPYGPNPKRPAGYAIDRARSELGFEPSALEDALAETLAWYRVAHPSHPGCYNRQNELALVS